jgi:hypothetical protein
MATKSDFKFVTMPTDDELRCDQCANSVVENGYWTATIPGYGSSGIAVFCGPCYEAFSADLKLGFQGNGHTG